MSSNYASDIQALDISFRFYMEKWPFQEKICSKLSKNLCRVASTLENLEIPGGFSNTWIYLKKPNFLLFYVEIPGTFFDITLFSLM